LKGQLLSGRSDVRYGIRSAKPSPERVVTVIDEDTRSLEMFSAQRTKPNCIRWICMEYKGGVLLSQPSEMWDSVFRTVLGKIPDSSSARASSLRKLIRHRTRRLSDDHVVGSIVVRINPPPAET
jgi:hypothetical protein